MKAEISGGVKARDAQPDADDAAGLAARRAKGNIRASSCTSSTPLPMKRFTEYTVRRASVISRRWASRPT